MLSLALTHAQYYALTSIEVSGFCPAWFCDGREWAELLVACYCWRDESGNYSAHETYQTPGFEMCEPDRRGLSSEAGDRIFEDSRESMFLSGKLRI